MKKLPLSTTALLMIALAKENCCSLVAWLNLVRNQYEQIDVHPWIGNFWYIVVLDTRICAKYPANSLIGFTVDVEEDRIFWANEQTYAGIGFTNGGNVFCRSVRWWRELKVKYPEAKSDRHEGGNVYDYRPRRVAKLRKG
jgi:hypothetical protein